MSRLDKPQPDSGLSLSTLYLDEPVWAGDWIRNGPHLYRLLLVPDDSGPPMQRIVSAGPALHGGAFFGGGFVADVLIFGSGFASVDAAVQACEVAIREAWRRRIGCSPPVLEVRCVAAAAKEGEARETA